jgi:heparan-alpha-glucosaminide N-acetyltransferase
MDISWLTAWPQPWPAGPRRLPNSHSARPALKNSADTSGSFQRDKLNLTIASALHSMCALVGSRQDHAMFETVPSSGATLQRNMSVDAYRGFAMLLMMGEVLRFPEVARSFSGSSIWQLLSYHQSHVEWAGMSLHDTIQPSFTFLVGVALPYSLLSRQRKGETFGHMLGHTIWRSFLLIALGIFLRSIHSPSTNFTFEDTLTQIGLGYTFAFLLAFVRPRWQWASLGMILFAYWLAWALYPAPIANFPYASVGVPADWHHLYSGFASHWNKNSNLGQAFDVWFLNLFPRPHRFLFNDGGYLTLSFIPTLGTMLLGMIGGRWLLTSARRASLSKFLLAAAALMAFGLLLHFAGICPIVKRIWTPSWTLFSGGICFLFLAAFSWVIDLKQKARLVVGMNSIAAYLIAHLFEDFVQSSFRINLGASALKVFGPSLEPLTLGVLTLVTYWLILYWMFRKKIFLRI